VLGLSLAYFGFRHNLPMTIRSALYPLIGNRMEGWAGNLVDILAIFGTMFGVATSLGLGVLQVNAGLNHVFDIPQERYVQVLLIAGITLVATISVFTGLDRGIRRLSQLNINLAVVVLVFVAVTGPTVLLISAYVENLGAYISGFVDVLFWSGSYDADQAAWLSGWTIFYWAWWISWAPFVGMFIARISRGRTIREFVAGVLLVPTL
jgi:choline/glycine/proline betaine transport protein